MYQTGYDVYAPMDYMNDYNKTGFLKLKYKNMNQTEIPQMNFVKKKDKLNIQKINNIDIDNMLRMNNIRPLKDISDELIFGEIRDEDFEDPNLPKLLKTYQYALEYLKAKSKKIRKTNEKLHIEYEQLINQSLEYEKKLEDNKKEISENKSKKREYEFLLLSYESLVNFNCNPIENTNIIMKNVKSNYGENFTEYEKNVPLGIRTYQKNARFYCHICNGKYFNSEIGLENHMKRRHLAQIRENKQREKEEMKEEEIEDFCNKKIEETANRFQHMLNQKYNILSQENIKEEINMIKRENDEKYKIMMENNKNNNEEMNLRLKELKMQQEEYNKNIINIVNAAKEKNENNENHKVTVEYPQVNDINKLINSLENIGEILKQQKNKNNDIENEMLKEIKDKLDNMKIPQNQNSIKFDYNINNNMNKDINLIKTNNNNIEDDLNNNNNNNNFNDNNKKNEINSPQNTLIDMKNKNENNIDENLINSFAKENNNIPNEHNNSQIKEENNNIIKDDNLNNNINNSLNNINNNLENKGEQNQNNKNNIISQNDFIPNNSLNHEEILDQSKKEEPIEIQREKKDENESVQEKEFNISQLQNNILESNIEILQNQGDINNNNLKNQNLPNQNNNNKIELPIIQEKTNINVDDNKNINVSNNSEMNKERTVDINNNEIKNDNNNSSAHFGKTSEMINNENNNKLLDFAQEFMKRDQPILEKKDLNLNDINGFSKEILADQNFKNNLSKNMEDFLDKNIEDKKIENMKDLDKKSEGELLNVITNTLNKINKINEKSNIAGLYFQTMNKMIDFKMVENEQKMMREAYNKKGELKSTRSNATKAKKVIEKAESDLKDSEI